MKLILHIGTEKTGTSSIQKYLYENRDLFMENGYFIPKTFGKYNHRKAPAYCVRYEKLDEFHQSNNIFTNEDLELFKQDLYEKVHSELVSMPDNIHTVIVSSEHFHSRLLFQDEVDTVKEFFSTFFDEYEIVIYLRRQIDLAISLYSTELKSGNVMKDIDTFVKNRCTLNNSYYNFKKFLSMWEKTFGKNNLNVRLFNRKELYKNDIIDDFMSVILPKISSDILDRAEKPQNENESLTVFGQDVMNIVNINLGKQEIASKVRNLINQNCSGKGKKPSYETASVVMECYSEINQFIREEYFSGRNELFDPSLENFKEKVAPTSENELKLFEEIINYLPRYVLDKEIDDIRDSAVVLEKTNIIKASKLMNIANRLRPEGNFIAMKVKEYKDLI